MSRLAEPAPRHVESRPRPHLAHLLLAAPAPALRRLGQRRARRRCCSCTAAATTAATGTGSPRSSPRLAHHRPRPARPRRQPVVAGRHLHDGRLHLRPRPAHPPAARRRPSPSSPTRSAATSPCATPASTPRTWPSWSPSRGSAPRPKMLAQRLAKPFAERMRDWIDEQRGLSGRLPRRYASHRGRLQAHAGGEPAPHPRAGAPPHRARRQPERGRHLQLEVRQLRALLAALRHARADIEELWARIACPTLLVYGKESWACNPAEDGRARNFKNAEVVAIDGAGHWVHHDRLDEFLALLRRFLGA